MRDIRILCLMLVLSVFALGARSANAQANPNFEIGLKPFGSYNGGNIDTVNLGNGSLGVDIPIISYPQRGGKLKLDLDLHYFNGYTYYLTPCYPMVGCILAPYGAGGGFSLIDKGHITPSGVCTNNLSCASILEPDGAQHELGAVNGKTNILESVDASGYMEVLNSSGSDGSIIDSAGTTYYPYWPVNACGGVGLPPCYQLRQDSNGNQISYGSVNGALEWLDTMGRAIPMWGSQQDTNPSDFVGCTGSQPVAYVYIWNPPGINGGTYPMKFCYYNAVAYVGQSFPELQSVVLPNNTAWTFAYEELGFSSQYGSYSMPTLTQITFPTGGTITYTWTGTVPCSIGITGGGELGPDNFAVASRVMNPNDGVDPAGTTSYSYSGSQGTGTVGSGVQTRIVTDANLNDTVHTFGLGGCFLYETATQVYQGSHTTGALLKTVNTTYSYTQATSNWGQLATLLNLVPTKVVTTLPNGQQSQVSHTYDTGLQFHAWEIISNVMHTLGSAIQGTYGRELTRSEYNYANPAPGTLLRTTTNTYLALSNSTYLTANLLNLPSAVIVTGSGPGSNTTYNYDETGSPAGAHGNLTSTHRWLNTTGGYVVSSNIYNSNGLVTSSTDPRLEPTTFGYTPTSCPANSGYAGNGPTSVTNALNQTTHYCYDLNMGPLISTTDPNGKTTSYQYDSTLRPTQVNNPDGGQATFSYPNPNQVNVTETISSSTNRLSSLLVDGVGRQIRQAVTNGESIPDDEADTCYDSVGRVSFKSYPFQDSGPFTTSRSCGSPELGDSFVFDALSRATSVTHSDASTVLTTYTGRATSVQDEGNGTQRVQRVSQVDGLGRLASLCEVTSTTLTVGITGSTTPAACGQDIAATGFLATYAYDALDDLTSVAQGPLNARMFVYDSLSRLTSGTDPESGTTTYTYDADGNVLTKKDARSTTITYAYDSLNRLTGKTYSDTTPAATYTYDQSSALGVTLTNTTGRMSSESTAGANPTGSVFSYDPMGRVNINSQCTPQNCSGTPFSVVYTYDFLGDVHTSTNGAAVTLTNSYNAAARLTSVASSLSDSNHPGTPFGYQNLARYNAAGSILSVTLGNGINETRAYDGRLRLTGITDGSVYTLTIPSGYAPNNDILAANDSVNGNWTYGYDAFNRLTGSNQNSGQNVFSYLYDRFGNRWKQNVTAGTGPAPSYGFDANNHIVAGSGVTYDAAGDTTDDGTTTYTFDAEGRIITASNGMSGASSYVYDAGGRRVRKTTVAGGTVDFLYDLAGHEVSQISSTGTWTRGEVYAAGRHLATYSGGTGGTTIFNHADWLGTERARSNVSGTLCESITSLPFGDAMTTSGSCSDVSPMHFTGKEHDTETNLENFGARYDASSMGRFMSPDPLGGHQEDPQTLNRYAYVRNNPMSLTDSTGLDFNLDCQKNNGTTCQGGHVYYQDQNGKYQETVVTSDSKGNLTDQSGNKYSGTFDGKNVNFTSADGTKSGGSWIQGSNDTSGIKGGGNLSDKFDFTFHNHGLGQDLNASFKYAGSLTDAERELQSAGFSHSSLDDSGNIYEMLSHPNATNFRTAGDPGTGGNSSHALVNIDIFALHPRNSVPTTGNVHVGEINPNQNLWEHFKQVF